MNTLSIRQQKQHFRLTQEQREIIVGKILGDGCLVLNQSKTMVRLQVEHSITQKEYVDWLYNKISALVRTAPQTKFQVIDGKTYQKYWFNTLSFGGLRFYYHQFYPEGRKIVPLQIQQWLTPRTLAVWFMDDGSIKSRFHSAKIINTQSFSKEDVLRLISIFAEKYGVKAKLRQQREGYQIYLLAETIERFESLIRPYILPSMTYKLG